MARGGRRSGGGGLGARYAIRPWGGRRGGKWSYDAEKINCEAIYKEFRSCALKHNHTAEREDKTCSVVWKRFEEKCDKYKSSCTDWWTMKDAKEECELFSRIYYKCLSKGTPRTCTGATKFAKNLCGDADAILGIVDP